MTRLPLLLRTGAFLIASIAVFDPGCAVATRERRSLGITILESSTLDLPAEGGTRRAVAADVRSRLAEALRRDYAIEPASRSGSLAAIVIADRAPSDAEWPSAESVFAVSLAERAGPDVRIESVRAPERLHESERATVEVALSATRMNGRRSAVLLRDEGIEVARTVAAWSSDDATQRVRMSYLPTRVGPAHLRAEVEPPAGGRGMPGHAADVRIDVLSEPRHVLVFEPRVSWASVFVRRALAADRAFRVTSVTRSTPGIVLTSGEAAPRALDRAEALSRFDAIVVGAPDALTENDVTALLEFLRVRGGRVVLVPDSPLRGPVLRLLPGGRWSLRVGRNPVPLAPPGDHDPALHVTEWLEAGRVDGGTDVLLRGAEAQGGAPVVVARAVGHGRLIVCGALDAWKHRDRAGASFDRFWQDTVAAAAAQAPLPVDATLTPSVVRPGERVQIIASVRQDALVDAGRALDVPRVSAAVTRGEPSSSPEASFAVRLWPLTEPGRFTGEFIAPAVGAWTVTVAHDASPAARTTASLLVRDDAAPPARDPRPGLALSIAARGGMVVTPRDLEPLVAQLRATRSDASVPHVTHPFRSPWWLALFAACLGGEWWLRRRSSAR